MAGTTRLELATSAVTGQRSNQLNYVPALRGVRRQAHFFGEGFAEFQFHVESEWWAVQDSNLRPPACKAGALTN